MIRKGTWITYKGTLGYVYAVDSKGCALAGLDGFAGEYKEWVKVEACRELRDGECLPIWAGPQKDVFGKQTQRPKL